MATRRTFPILSTTIGTLVVLLALLPTTVTAAEERGAAATLHSLIDDEWSFRVAENPILATRQGVESSYDQWPTPTPDARASRADALRGFLDRLDSIDREALDEADRVTYDVFAWELSEQIAEIELGHHRFPLNADSGFHTAAAWLPQFQPLANVDQYKAYIRRLRAMPAYFAAMHDVLREAIEAGWTQPRVVLEGYEVTIASHVVDEVEESVFYAPFENFPTTVPESERAKLAAAGAEAVMAGPVAAFRDFLDFFENVYRPAARESVGISAVPGGEEYYANRVRHYTTLDLDADAVHEIGLREVARIRAEMEAVIDEVRKVGEFEGSFADFLAFLRTDPRFYADTPEALLKEASWIAKRMDGALPRLFGRLPRQPYGVEPVPDYLAPKYTGGRYVPAPLDSTRAGTYWVNTWALDKRPLYTLEALSLHEAVPGHHLQGALSKELDLPEFRRDLYISAFGEGWGLYSERLGLEAGFYTDPYSNFGRLTYEMWRACRLVVDTGLHAKGWSRQQALDYLAENTALSLHEVTTEIDRYIAWPGQALAYKIGELEIRELRSEAEAALGSDFDLRAFHDLVLSEGAVPLPVLRGKVERWIEREKSRPEVEAPAPS